MVHEISQFDIPDRQLLASNKQPGLEILTDIGEARITRTIFGRAKVRVVRERDKKRRTWLLSVLAVMVLSAAAWQGWVALQRSELLVAQAPLSERIKVSAPVFNQEDAIPSDNTSSSKKKQRTPTQILLDSMATHRPPEPQQMIDKAPGQNAAKPAAVQASAAGKPVKALAANNSPADTQPEKNQADLQHPPGMPAPVHPVAPAAAASPDTQPKADKAAAAAPPADSIIREDTLPLSPPVGTQPSGASGSQP
jgi:hypothetical protein